MAKKSDLEDVKEKYKVTSDFQSEGKLILILGAGGNWGGHFSLGMPAACKCDAILSEEKEETLKEIINDIKTSKLPVKTFTYYYSKEQKKDRISLYDLIEKKFGHISCILDVEGINTNYSFPNSAEIEQKPILNKEDMKPRYQIGPNDFLNGKKIIIVGAAGNWGSYMALGMGLAGRADLILVDKEEKKNELEKLKSDIGNSVKIDIELIGKNENYNRFDIYKRIEKKYGNCDSFMDMYEINTNNN